MIVIISVIITIVIIIIVIVIIRMIFLVPISAIAPSSFCNAWSKESSHPWSIGHFSSNGSLVVNISSASLADEQAAWQGERKTETPDFSRCVICYYMYLDVIYYILYLMSYMKLMYLDV